MGTVLWLIPISAGLLPPINPTAQHYMIVVLFTLLFLFSARSNYQLHQERVIQQEANPTSPVWTDEDSFYISVLLRNYANDKQLIDLDQKLMMKTVFYFIATIAIGFLMYSPK
jgi:hypothetical protein